MGGIKVQIRHDDEALRSALQRAARFGVRIPPILMDIGEGNLIATRLRFKNEVDPQGRAWAPLHPAYRVGKKGRKILQGLGMRGGLLGSIAWQLGGPGTVEVGTNKAYARIHQLGGKIVPKHGKFLRFAMGGKSVRAKSVTIPARPYLGVSSAERATWPGMIADHFEAHVKGR